MLRRILPAVASLLLASTAIAEPALVSSEEHDRQTRVLDQLSKSLAAESIDAAKFVLITRVMKEERDIDLRGRVLDVATHIPGPILMPFSPPC